jgi:hypothetical protein
MAELKANLGPYHLEQALEADRTDDTCFVLDVGLDDKGNRVESLKHVDDVVDEYILKVGTLPIPTTKLYVVGEWNTASGMEESDEATESGGQDHTTYKVSTVLF